MGNDADLIQALKSSNTARKLLAGVNLSGSMFGTSVLMAMHADTDNELGIWLSSACLCSVVLLVSGIMWMAIQDMDASLNDGWYRNTHEYKTKHQLDDLID